MTSVSLDDAFSVLGADPRRWRDQSWGEFVIEAEQCGVYKHEVQSLRCSEINGRCRIKAYPAAHVLDSDAPDAASHDYVAKEFAI